MRYLLFLGLTVLSFLSLGQNIEIELKNVPIELKNRNFYISKVLDGRKDTSRIGWSVINKDTRAKSYDLKGGLSKSLYDYLSQLKPDSGQVPLVLNVISLVVVERAKIIREARAQVTVQFLREKEGGYGKVYETSVFTEATSEIGKDLYTTHERRVRIVLTKCLQNLMESNWVSAKPDYVSLAEIRQESQALDTLSKVLTDTVGLFGKKKMEDASPIALGKIEYRKGFLAPVFIFNTDRNRTLWPFKRVFRQTNDPLVQKMFIDYKAKFRLTFVALGLGAGLIAVSMTDPSFQDEGIPNLGLAVPGAVFALCSIPIYIKTNKLARKTVDRFNMAIENK